MNSYSLNTAPTTSPRTRIKRVQIDVLSHGAVRDVAVERRVAELGSNRSRDVVDCRVVELGAVEEAATRSSVASLKSELKKEAAARSSVASSRSEL